VPGILINYIEGRNTMSEQKLFTDLAIAERNSKRNVNKKKIHFALEVREAFIKNNVDSFLDLVRKDIKTALQLHELASREQLL
jgi:hypothetical protein